MMTSEATLLGLEFPSPQVPSAHPEAHDHPAMEVTDTVVVSWCLVPASRVTTANPLRLPLSSSSSELSVRK